MKKTNKQNKITKKNQSIFSSDNEMAKLILLIIIVAASFAIFYIITLVVIKKDDKNAKNDQETVEVTIQYKKILVSNILSQKNSEYYVLAYTKNDPYYDSYENNLQYYEMAKDDSVPYYFVELDNTFNKNFISEKSNLKVEKAEEFKFKETTLLRIKDGKVISTYEGKDSITGKLGRMTK